MNFFERHGRCAACPSGWSCSSSWPWSLVLAVYLIVALAFGSAAVGRLPVGLMIVRSAITVG